MQKHHISVFMYVCYMELLLIGATASALTYITVKGVKRLTKPIDESEPNDFRSRYMTNARFKIKYPSNITFIDEMDSDATYLIAKVKRNTDVPNARDALYVKWYCESRVYEFNGYTYDTWKKTLVAIEQFILNDIPLSQLLSSHNL